MCLLICDQYYGIFGRVIIITNVVIFLVGVALLVASGVAFTTDFKSILTKSYAQRIPPIEDLGTNKNVTETVTRGRKYAGDKLDELLENVRYILLVIMITAVFIMVKAIFGIATFIARSDDNKYLKAYLILLIISIFPTVVLLFIAFSEEFVKTQFYQLLDPVARNSQAASRFLMAALQVTLDCCGVRGAKDYFCNGVYDFMCNPGCGGVNEVTWEAMKKEMRKGSGVAQAVCSQSAPMLSLCKYVVNKIYTEDLEACSQYEHNKCAGETRRFCAMQQACVGQRPPRRGCEVCDLCERLQRVAEDRCWKTDWRTLDVKNREAVKRTTYTVMELTKNPGIVMQLKDRAYETGCAMKPEPINAEGHDVCKDFKLGITYEDSSIRSADTRFRSVESSPPPVGSPFRATNDSAYLGITLAPGCGDRIWQARQMPVKLMAGKVLLIVALVLICAQIVCTINVMAHNRIEMLREEERLRELPEEKHSSDINLNRRTNNFSETQETTSRSVTRDRDRAAAASAAAAVSRAATAAAAQEEEKEISRMISIKREIGEGGFSDFSGQEYVGFGRDRNGRSSHGRSSDRRVSYRRDSEEHSNQHARESFGSDRRRSDRRGSEGRGISLETRGTPRLRSVNYATSASASVSASRRYAASVAAPAAEAAFSFGDAGFRPSPGEFVYSVERSGRRRKEHGRRLE